MRAGYRVIAFVHDEFLIELQANEDNTAAARDIERICCETMAEFRPGVKIATEYTLSGCWSKGAGRLRSTPRSRPPTARIPAQFPPGPCSSSGCMKSTLLCAILA